MANKKIRDAALLPTLSGTDEFEVDDGSNTYYKTNTDKIKLFTDANFFAMGEPNGIADITQSTIFFVNATRSFSINPLATDFDYYIGATKYTSTGDFKVIADIVGLHLLYYDGATLTEIVNPTNVQISNIILYKCIIAYVYWDGGIGKLLEERHGIVMDGATHLHLHFSIGTQYQDGLALGNFLVDQNGSLDSHAQFSTASGVISDEDLQLSINAIGATTGLEIWYLEGTTWKWTTNVGFSVLTTGSGRLAYNDTGAQAEVPNNQFVLCHVFAWNAADQKPIAIQGQNYYGNITAAREGAQTEIANLILSNLPSPEMKPIGTVIFQTSDTYTNSVKGRVRSTDTGENYVDFRRNPLNATVTASDHGQLAGLTDDDHLQYAFLNGRSGDVQKIDAIEEYTTDLGVTIEEIKLRNKILTIPFHPGEIFFGTPTDAPYGWYHCNSSSGNIVYDSSGFGRNGTTVNMDDSNWVPGKLNKCLTYDGINEYVNLGNIAGFDRGNTFSLECWLKTSTDGKYIISKLDATTPFRGWGMYIAAGGYLHFLMTHDQPFGNRIVVRANDTVLTDNAWHHCVVTYDGSSTAAGVVFYVDNHLESKVVTTDNLTNTITNAINCQISGRDGADTTFNGLIDEVLIYPTTLDATDVANRWNGGVGTESLTGFLNVGRLSVAGATGVMTQQYGGDCEIVTTASGSKIKLVPPSDGGVEITDGEYFQWLSGTTAQRPSSPVNGMVRYNSDTNRNEFYENGVWENYLTENAENLWDRELISGSDYRLNPHNAGDRVNIDLTSAYQINKSDFLKSHGTNNISLGFGAATSITTGQSDILIGSNAGASITSGSYNVFIGTEAGYSTTTTNDNVYIGYYAGHQSTGVYQTLIGTGAGASLLGTSSNTFIGAAAGYQATTCNDSTLVGAGTGFNLTTGSKHVLIGYHAGESLTTQSENVFIGYLAGQNSIAINNILIGTEVGKSLTTGGSNVFIGNSVATGANTTINSVIIGHGAGLSLVNGNNNVLIGRSAGGALTNESGNIVIGYLAGQTSLTASNKLWIDNSDTSAPLIEGDFATNALKINGTLDVTGKLTVGGLIDPTGLILDAQASAPSTNDGTIYYDSGAAEFKFRENGIWETLSATGLWQRTVTTLSPLNAGDSIDLGTGKLNASLVSIGWTGAMSGLLYVNQNSTTLGEPAMVINQQDASEGFINLIGNAAPAVTGDPDMTVYVEFNGVPKKLGLWN